MGSVTRSKRVKVIEAHARGLTISDCARLVKVSYETARRYVKEAQMLGAAQAVAQPSHRVWPVELKRQIGRRWLAGENSMALVKEYSLPGSSYPSLFGRWVEREENGWEKYARILMRQKPKHLILLGAQTLIRCILIFWKNLVL